MKITEYEDNIFKQTLYKENENSKLKKIWNWILSERLTIFHGMILIVLTLYIILNWNICVSMQFFSHFNGNNILFILWIALIFLMIYDVEAKGIKLKKHKMQEEFENAGRLYTLNSMAQNINNTSKYNQEGDANNGSSNQNDDC